MDRAAAGQAYTALATVEELLKLWDGGGPAVLRAGGMSVRELKRAATALDVTEPVAAFWVELGDAAGLLATDGEATSGTRRHRRTTSGWTCRPSSAGPGSSPPGVRLYSVDERGRRGVVFRSLDASRLIPVLVARAAFRLPYVWSRMDIERSGDTLTYTSTRRRPGPRGARSRIVLRAGDAIEEPTPLEHFLTARWALHSSFFGRTVYLPNAHPQWPLHRAELLECDEDLVAAGGLPAPAGDPVSVLYSPGVPVRFGPQRRGA
ncbi:hypothetical protein SMICM17S_12191 [Streptomyces microflavus]